MADAHISNIAREVALHGISVPPFRTCYPRVTFTKVALVNCILGIAQVRHQDAASARARAQIERALRPGDTFHTDELERVLPALGIRGLRADDWNYLDREVHAKIVGRLLQAQAHEAHEQHPRRESEDPERDAEREQPRQPEAEEGVGVVERRARERQVKYVQKIKQLQASRNYWKLKALKLNKALKESKRNIEEEITLLYTKKRARQYSKQNNTISSHLD